MNSSTSSAGMDASPPTYEAYHEFRAGMLGYVSSDFEDATAHLAEAYKLDSTFPTPLLFESISLSNQGRYQEADSIAHILARMRARLNPFYQDWLDYRLAFLAGNRPRALAAVRRLANHAPGTKATYNLGVEALENGHVDEAIRALTSLPSDRGPMRGWAAYWELLGTAYHLKGEYPAELKVGEDARSGFPVGCFPCCPSVRALAAMGRDAELSRLLDESATLNRDPAGRPSARCSVRPARRRSHTAGPLLAGPTSGELCAGILIGFAIRGATHADSIATANVLYGLGRWKEAAPLAEPSPGAAEEIGLAGLIAAQVGRIQEARAIESGLAEDRRPYPVRRALCR